MSDQPKTTTIIVKGGTTSARQDRKVARERFAAEQRRAQQDQMYDRARKPDGQGVARLGTHALMNSASPRLVLHYVNSDMSVRQDCKSEVTMVPRDNPTSEETMEAMFSLVCPKCVARGVPMGDAQMMVRESHRKWWLEPNRKTKSYHGISVQTPGRGDVVQVVYGWGVREHVIVAGTVTAADVIRCDNVNCDYACRVDHSYVFDA